jgi:hypothetical protein
VEDVSVHLDAHDDDEDDKVRCSNDGHGDVNCAKRIKNNKFKMEDCI